MHQFSVVVNKVHATSVTTKINIPFVLYAYVSQIIEDQNAFI